MKISRNRIEANFIGSLCFYLDSSGNEMFYNESHLEQVLVFLLLK